MLSLAWKDWERNASHFPPEVAFQLYSFHMNVHNHPDLLTHWSKCPVKLLARLEYYSSVLYDDKLMVSGGYDGNATSDKIHELQVVPPYTAKILSRMPEPRQSHCTEIFDDSLLILGGKTIGNYLSSVALYDIKNNVCKQLKPLPYKVSKMATVRWGDNVVVIGSTSWYWEGRWVI